MYSYCPHAGHNTSCRPVEAAYDMLRAGGHDRLQASLLAGLPPSQRWRGVPGCSLAQLALAWCCTNRFVSTVILGATRVEQLVDNFAGLAVVEKLTPDVLAEIEALLDVRNTACCFSLRC